MLGVTIRWTRAGRVAHGAKLRGRAATSAEERKDSDYKRSMARVHAESGVPADGEAKTRF